MLAECYSCGLSDKELGFSVVDLSIHGIGDLETTH